MEREPKKVHLSDPPPSFPMSVLGAGLAGSEAERNRPGFDENQFRRLRAGEE